MRIPGTLYFEPTRVEHSNAIDADGHIIEPPDLWIHYAEARLRDRMVRISCDADGLEWISFDGAPSKLVRPGAISAIATMGQSVQPGGDRRYLDTMPYGGADPAERVALLDRENIDRAVLYPTIGLMWEAEITDRELTYAYARAYNRFIADFCRDHASRLIAVAHIPLLDVDLAVIELRRAVADGCRGAFVATFTHTRRPHGHADHDPLWAAAQDLDVPITIHPVNEPRWADPAAARFDGAASYWYANVTVRERMILVFFTFFSFGTLGRFPELKLGVMESGGGWIGPLLERMDTVFEHSTGNSAGMAAMGLTDRPSGYFRRQCFISCDPYERAVVPTIERIGSQCFVWATDYPHGDHPSTYAHDINGFVAPLSEGARQHVLGGNVARLYDLPTR